MSEDLKLYKSVEFSDLFDSKQQAVTCFLSLERKYMDLFKLMKQEQEGKE